MPTSKVSSVCTSGATETNSVHLCVFSSPSSTAIIENPQAIARCMPHRQRFRACFRRKCDAAQQSQPVCSWPLSLQLPCPHCQQPEQPRRKQPAHANSKRPRLTENSICLCAYERDGPSHPQPLSRQQTNHLHSLRESQTRTQYQRSCCPDPRTQISALQHSTISHPTDKLGMPFMRLSMTGSHLP